MAVSVILIFKFGGCNALKKFTSGMNYGSLIDFVISKWDSLSPNTVRLSYTVHEVGSCLLDDDNDLTVMMDLVDQCSLERLEVIVKQKDYVDASDLSIVTGGTSGMVVGTSDITGVINDSVSSSKQNVLLSANWIHLIGGVGQVFEGGAVEFRMCLSKYAYESGFLFNYVKNDRTRVTDVCKYREYTNCQWRIHASVEDSNKFFYIRTFEKFHTCDFVFSSANKIRMGADVVAGFVVDDIRSMPTMSARDIIHQAKDKYGIDISYFVAWTALQKARSLVFGTHSSSYSLLNSYFTEAGRNNPESVFHLDFDSEQMVFKRCFFGFGACLIGFRFCRPIMFPDETFFKGRHNGILLSAVSKDGNDSLFPVAFAVVHEENDSNWNWFLTLLKEAINSDRVMTFISDRNHGILEGVKNVFPDCFHSYCLLHLRMNLKDKFKGVSGSYRNHIVNQFVACAYAPTSEIFDKKIEQLKIDGSTKIVNFLSGLPYGNWANAYFEGPRYGEMYSNAVESWNSQILKFWDLPITNLVDSIRSLLMTQISARHDLASRWTSVLCPKWDEKIKIMHREGRTWKVKKSSDYVYEVFCTPVVVVDLSEKSCSCRRWKISGFPCVHAVCVLVNTRSDVYSFVDRFFYTCLYRDSYSASIFPFVRYGPSAEDIPIGPPIQHSRRGRPKKNMIPSRGEVLKRKIRCGRCGQIGNHNKKTCIKDM